jgi:outer membrane protein assembly factor BamB/tRNA A-37 threonylcarbamoyl transferase component Bud32
MGPYPDSQDETRPLSDDEAPEQRLAPEMVLVNRYAIEEVIGVGGMGSVYRARDLHFPAITKLVAVKEMISEVRDQFMREMIVKNFEREANLLATLSHPSIPRIYDYFTQDERSYLVLEFIHGKDLEAILSESQELFPVEQVVGWAIELCDVLDYLHTHKPEPIIFRDMKPSNVMINQHGRIVLIDFGIAKAFQHGQKGTMMGTEGYSPPEQYRGEGSPVGDIYALGATLHHILTRKDPQKEPPFTFAERPIREFNPQVSPELEAVIKKALEYLPEDRYQSAKEMKEALVHAIRMEGISGGRIAVPGVIDRVGQEIKPRWVFEAEDEIRGSPVLNGGVVYFGALDNNLYALDAEGGEFFWKYPTKGGIVGRPAVHEYFIYIGSEDNYLHVVSTRTGQVVWTYRTEGRVRASPVVTDDFVFIGSDDCSLHGLNLMTGRRLWRYVADGPVRSTPFVDDKLIYFGCEEGDFFCIDTMGELHWHFKSKRAVTSSPLVSDGMVFFGSMDASFYAFDAKMGWEVWRYRMGKGSISSPCIYRDMIFTGCVDGMIYCLDRDNGREIWTYQTGHQVTGSPVVNNGMLLCGSVDGNMYCLDAVSGSLIWKFASGGPITGAPAVSDDYLFFGSTDHHIYAIQI